MTLEPLLSAPVAVQIHVATVVPAFFLGTWQIFISRKGSPLHRVLGYVFLALMTVTSVAALFIHQITPDWPLGLSPIHIFVPLTLFSVGRALSAARSHKIAVHKRAMLGAYIGGLLIAGTLAFAPDRIMNAIFFS